MHDTSNETGLATSYTRHYNPAIQRPGQDIYRFENGYGASVIKSCFSYGGPQGLYELAVCRIEELADGDFDWHGMWSGELEDTAPGLTDDVHGYLTEQEVQDLLDRIAGL